MIPTYVIVYVVAILSLVFAPIGYGIYLLVSGKDKFSG